MSFTFDITGSNNDTNIILSSKNGKVSKNNYVNIFINDIKSYIKTQLTTLLTDNFISNNDISTLSSNLINNFELCWVGMPETFYEDINSSELKNTTNKIFTHLDNNLSSKTIYLQKSDGTYISTILNFTDEIIKKIDFVNKNVPSELIDTPQGLHVLGILNNSTIINGTNTNAKTLLNLEFFGLKEYFGLSAYTRIGENTSGTLEIISNYKKIVSSDISDINIVEDPIMNLDYIYHIRAEFNNCKLDNKFISELPYEFLLVKDKIFSNNDIDNSFIYMKGLLPHSTATSSPNVDPALIPVHYFVDKKNNHIVVNMLTNNQYIRDNLIYYYKRPGDNRINCNLVTYQEI